MRAMVDGRVIFDKGDRHGKELILFSVFWVLGMLILIFFIRNLRKLRKPRIAHSIVRR
jgi:hypothetical protein